MIARNSDKEYHAAVEPRGEGYIVTFAYGRRGNTLTTGAKTTHPVTFDEAIQVFDKLVRSKLAKGYHITDASVSAKPFQRKDTAYLRA